jgi:hypothetical protein
MFKKQLQQPSNAANRLGFACDERNIYKSEERKNRESKQARSFGNRKYQKLKISNHLKMLKDQIGDDSPLVHPLICQAVPTQF